jgi:hypothetical protein
MAQQNKTQLKTYYQTGDTPTSDQYSELIDSQLNLAETEIQIGEFSVSSSGNLRMMGSSSFVGDVTASGDISASSASTITGGTGSFSNLFGMNQAVRTTDNVTFNTISLSKTALSDGVFGGIINASGQSFTMTINSIPLIPGTASSKVSKTIPTTITNSSVAITSVVLSSSTTTLSISTFAISNGSFQISLGNESALDFTAGEAVLNFTIF